MQFAEGCGVLSSMPKLEYRGETASKRVSRWLVWWMHRRLLEVSFQETPHVFLASRVGGDINTLMSMGVVSDQIWAVDKDRKQCVPLYHRMGRQGFRVFNRKVEDVVDDFSVSNGIRSVYLDFCGTLDGEMQATLQRVVPRMRAGSVVSVTFIRGREQLEIRNREAFLLRLIQGASRHRVSLSQVITYMSNNSDGKGSPMATLTFYVGKKATTVSRFDLTGHSELDLAQLAASKSTCRKLWAAECARAAKGRRAALKAWATRRAA